MEGDVLVFAQVMTVIVASTGAFVAIGLGARMLWRAGSRAKSKAVPPVDDTRLDRLEAAVDAIAIEVERISESQRYTVSLLSDRLPPPGERSLKRVTTPHYAGKGSESKFHSSQPRCVNEIRLRPLTSNCGVVLPARFP